MIQTKLGHIQCNVNSDNLSFYKELFVFMGWKILEDEHTYYQVMFESPDRILFEVVYMGRLKE
jgi:hypothetical protein